MYWSPCVPVHGFGVAPVSHVYRAAIECSRLSLSGSPPPSFQFHPESTSGSFVLPPVKIERLSALPLAVVSLSKTADEAWLVPPKTRSQSSGRPAVALS